MTQPIYKVFLLHATEAWYQLSPEEQRSKFAKLREASEAVGKKVVCSCDSSWASDHWQYFGVEEFPDLEAEQKYTQLLRDMNWFRYADSITLLGIQAPPP